MYPVDSCLEFKEPRYYSTSAIFNSWKHFLETWVYRIGNISGLATHSCLLFYLSVFPFSISPIVAYFCPSVCQAWYRNIDWDKAHLKPHPHTPLRVAISTCWKEWKLLQTISNKKVLTQNCRAQVQVQVRSRSGRSEIDLSLTLFLVFTTHPHQGHQGVLQWV